MNNFIAVAVFVACVLGFGVQSAAAYSYPYGPQIYPTQQYQQYYQPYAQYQQYGYNSGYQAYNQANYIPQQNMNWGFRYAQPQVNDTYSNSFYHPQYTSYGYCLPMPSGLEFAGSNFCMY